MSDAVDLSKPFASIFNALDMKEQRKALRNAMGKEANRVKKEAQQSILSSGLGHGTNTDITAGVRARVYPPPSRETARASTLTASERRNPCLCGRKTARKADGRAREHPLKEYYLGLAEKVKDTIAMAHIVER